MKMEITAAEAVELINQIREQPTLIPCGSVSASIKFVRADYPPIFRPRSHYDPKQVNCGQGEFFA